MKKKYTVVAKNQINGTEITGDITHPTKAEARELISILKLVNPRLTYEIKETHNET